jgi:predicted nucleic acid-binding protein
VVIFWDTSAIVPLAVDEPASAAARTLLEADPGILVWWATPIECLSAIARREREGVITPDGADDARKVIAALGESWAEMLASEEVRQHAIRLLLRHPLRAADALQLAAAITWARAAPSDHGVATLDDRLRTAARAEGFRLPLTER